MAEEEKQAKAKRGGTAVIAVCGAVIVVLLAVIIGLVVKQNSASQTQNTAASAPETPKRDVVVTPDNVDEIVSQMDEDDYTPPGSYEVTMNMTWYFKDGASASDNAYVENSVSNTNDVYFDITLADTGENIYSSPVLPLGSSLENITLDKPLEDGTYDCVVTYTLVDEEQTPISTVRVGLTIVVGE
jgi:hypothetical protein